ncbi:probable G-protein coupled receptor 171 [Mugil cephalus]|uniref:probable G-protein coupled receptor 171 n=1 Tax=Mugil cephalus TaxID=48193 RepID=UPI001FB58900|nr:probable G-protein coupled receptor 171 [Mugil cephalus]XP_047449226.1 probable G-protein coupled receptor 171 [Mugil cephalus]XP_047449227.1 probable G-protein coupled receptor 171 [Mugil cephalus]XP_047449229.1 probable G-protein coupled receptor 171 [Mugil cephalus]
MSPPSNSTDGCSKCIVNDQMGPFTVLYILIYIISLPGNLASAWAFFKCSTRDKPPSSRIYLVNLLVADLLLLLALPFKILKDLGAASWDLMVFHCQASGVTIYISLYASIAFLAFIITDRCLQDCQTVSTLRMQEAGFARLLSLVVWLLLLLIMVPNMALPIKHVQQCRYLSCSSLKQDISLHWHALTIVLCTALFLNASAAVLISAGLAFKRLLRSRGDPKLWADARRAAASVAAVALAYVLSFVPYHIVRTPYTLAQTKIITDCRTKRELFLAKESTLLLSVLHVCFDPVFFFYLSEPFRQTLREMFPIITRRWPVKTPEQHEEREAAEETLHQTCCAKPEAEV